MKVVQGKQHNVEKCIALALSLAVVSAAFASPEWTLVYEKPGETNTVTAADNRTAISVELVKSGDQWAGKIMNREPGATVRSLEIRSEPFKVDVATDAFYIPWSTGGSRIKVWPSVGWTPKTGGRNILAAEFDKEYALGGNFWVPKGNGLFEIDPRMRMPGVRGGMQFMTVANKTRGLYVGSHDPRFTCMDFTGVYDAKAATFVLGVKFNLWLRSGDDFVVTPVVMAEYAGDWHVAAKRYREWWDRCFRVAYVPNRVKDMTGVFIVLLKQQNDEIIWPYTEFDSLGRCAQSYGFDHVEFHAWGKGGHDRLYPEYEPDPLMGGKEGLIKGVQTLKDMGIHATVYSNGQLQERETTEYWRTKGKGGAIVNRDGTEHTETWHKFTNRPAHTFDVVCYHQQAWKDRMLEICRDAKAYGFEGFFYDQIGVSRPRQCFATNHGHRPGDWVYAGDRHDLFKSIADVIHSEDPEFVLSAEGFHDAIFDSCAWFEGWAEEGFAWSRFDKEYVQDFYPEFVLYTFPEVVTTDRSYTPSYDRRQLNGAVVLNLRVNFAIRYRIDRAFVEEGKVPTAADTQYMKSPTDHKAMAKADWAGNRAYMKLVNEWRKANRELLLRGTFKADEGFEIVSGGDYVANRWDSADGRTGILVWNGDMTRSQDFTVKYHGQLLYAEEPEAGKVDAASAIPANTLRLYVFKATR